MINPVSMYQIIMNDTDTDTCALCSVNTDFHSMREAFSDVANEGVLWICTDCFDKKACMSCSNLDDPLFSINDLMMCAKCLECLAN